MRLFRLFLRTAPGPLAFAVLFGVLSGLVSTYLLIQVNHAIAGQATITFALFAAVALGRFAARFASQLQLHALAQGAMFRLRQTLGRQLLATPLRTLEELGPAKLLAVLTEDVLVLTQGGFGVALILTHAGFVLACLAYLGSLSLLSLGITMATVLATFVVQNVCYKYAFSRLFRRAREDADLMFGAFQGITEGAKELKLHPARREAFFAEALDVPAERYRRRHVRGGAVLVIADELVATMFFVLVGFLLLAWPSVRPVDHATVVSYVLAVLYLQASLDVIFSRVQNLAQADAALEKMESIGLALPAQLDPVGTTANADWTSIELRGVTHAYKSEADDRTFTLGPIDYVIRPGETVFVVGANGSGKSTFAKLLTGLYTPSEGAIVADGEVVTDETRGAYRQRFSAVFSDWFLFDRLFGLDTSDDEARRYLKELRLDAKVRIEAGKFSTTALSQGQRKRLMLLTAYLEDRPIYLFDEWAADQDPLFKDVFYRQILSALQRRGKTVIVITHDDRYFELANRLVRLEDGKMIEVAAPKGASAGDAEHLPRLEM